jgi:hypothetical protein
MRKFINMLKILYATIFAQGSTCDICVIFCDTSHEQKNTGMKIKGFEEVTYSSLLFMLLEFK